MQNTYLVEDAPELIAIKLIGLQNSLERLELLLLSLILLSSWARNDGYFRARLIGRRTAEDDLRRETSAQVASHWEGQTG